MQAQPYTDHRRLLSGDEAAQVLRVSRSTLKRHIASGALPQVKLGGLVRIRPQDLDQFVEDRLERRERP